MSEIGTPNKRKPLCEALCNECGERTQHSTQTEAFAAAQTHWILTDHEDQSIATPAFGWTRWKTLDYSLTTAGLLRAKEKWG